MKKEINFNFETIKIIEKKLHLNFKEFDKNENYKNEKNYFTEIDILNYIYGFLHHPKFREDYKEFLKIDFPKISFDISKEKFFKIAKIGEELKKLHLMENNDLENFIEYPVDGENEIEKITFKDEKIFINKEQYFNGIKKEVWEFFIGGYQPAQKWLKDRKGKKLNNEDILHYSKIIGIIQETNEIMLNLKNIEI